MHQLRLILLAAVAALVCACGADESEPTPVAATPTPTPAGAIELDLRRDPDAWPELPGGRLEPDALVAAPETVGPPSNVQAELILPARGRAGVFCGGYGLVAGADGRYAIHRLADEKEVLDGRAEAGGRSDPGEPTVLRLVCDGDSIGFMVNASPIAFARDERPAPDARPGQVGVLSIGAGEDARVLQFRASS